MLCEDEILTVLWSVGYRGIPSRESLANKDKLIRYMFSVINTIKKCLRWLPIIVRILENTVYSLINNCYSLINKECMS